MYYSKAVDAHTRYFYEVKNGQVWAGQDGPGPAGGGAHSCSYREFLEGSGAGEQVKSFIRSEFGSSAVSKVEAFLSGQKWG